MRDECRELALRIGRDPEDVIEWWAERAAIREVEGGQPRAEAERAAFDDIRDQLEARRGPRSVMPATSDKKREQK